MSYRYMRLLLFFDLPRLTAKQRSQAAKFQRELIKEGFLMLQESVYCKLALNNSVMDAINARVRQLKPDNGDIMLLTITEKQFEKIDFIFEKSVSSTLDSTDRLIIL